MTGTLAANILDYAPTWPTVNLNSVVNATIQLLFIVGGIGFLVMILVGGIMLITSGGSKVSTERSQKIITNAFIGIVFLASSGAVAAVIEHVTGVNIFGPHIIVLPRPGPEGELEGIEGILNQRCAAEGATNCCAGNEPCLVVGYYSNYVGNLGDGYRNCVTALCKPEGECNQVSIAWDCWANWCSHNAGRCERLCEEYPDSMCGGS